MPPDDGRGYEDFRIRISGGREHYNVRATCRGAAVSGTFQRPFTDEGLELLILRTQARRGTTRAVRKSEGIAAAREIGEGLYGALFHGVVGALLWKESDAVGDGLRITLELSDVPELMDLPWEYLYDPDRGHFLAFSLSTPIVRYLDVPSAQRPLEVAPPLRMLAMTSSPSDVVELDVEHERNRLNGALEELVAKQLVTIDWLENGTRQALRQKLRRAAPNAPYHVFHYIGHGTFDDARGEGFLLFEDANQRSDLVDGRYLGQMLYEHKSLRLAVLNACEGARAANPLNEPFAGVAARLVRNEIPAVIAMQFEITDDAAALFSKNFYEAIARGAPVDSALVQCRQDLSDADPHGVEWGTPVLFMRVDDGQIFDVAEVAPPGNGGTVRTTNGEKRSHWLRTRNLILAAVCLAIAGTAIGIAAIIGKDGSASDPDLQTPSIVADVPLGNSSQPAWRPNGAMLAFTIESRKENVLPRMYVADIRRSSSTSELSLESQRALGLGATPSFARSGRLAYYGGSGIWVTDTRQAQHRPLTNDSDSTQPSWSPSGSRVVFSSKREKNPDRDLWVMSASRSDVRRSAEQLTRDADGVKTDDVSPVWSPDGTRIAFIRKPADSTCPAGDVWIVDVGGQDAHPLVALSGDERSPSWSPNGNKIVFSSDVDGSYDLYTVDADGSDQVRLTDTNDDELDPSWGPDGILYARGTFDCSEGARSQRLWVLPANS